jgi:hypothetical protein
MAEDLVLAWQNKLRDFHAAGDYPLINDLMILEIATMLGGIEPIKEKPIHTQYRKLDTVNDSQLAEIFSSLQDNVRETRIDPETPIGIVAATSISEPIYQGGLRTFHYAGVLTKKDAFDLLNTEVGTLPNKNALVAMALKPEIRFNKNRCKQIAYGLRRSVLSDYVGIVKDQPALRDFHISGAVEAAKHAMDAFDSDERYEVLEKKIRNGEEIIEVAGDRLPAYDKAYQEYWRLYNLRSQAAIESDSINDYFFYLKTPRQLDENPPSGAEDHIDSDGELVRAGEQILNYPVDLWTIVRRQIKSADGMFRTVEAFPNLFNNATMEEKTVTVGDEVVQGVVLRFPYLTRSLSVGLIDTLNRLEFCNNCKLPTTLAKLVHKAGKGDKEKVEDEEWESTAPVTEYDRALVKAVLEETQIKSNPDDGMSEEDLKASLIAKLDRMDDSSLEQLRDEAVGLLEVDMTESDRYDFELAELGRILRRCGGCGMGWFNISASAVKVDYGTSIQDYDRVITEQDVQRGDYDSEDLGLVKDFKIEDEKVLINVGQHIGSLDFKINGRSTVYPEDVGFITYPGVSRKGQNSDYPIHFAHGGRLPNDLIEDEYYILISYKDIVDSRMNNFRGHFETAQDFEWCDFSRTTTNNMKQVERVLGIEAARMQLAHNMFNAQGNGATIENAGNSSPVHFKHYMLLADSLCRGISVAHARSGSASVSGLAATKGSRTVKDPETGKITAYLSVLAQAAYERQVEVLLSAAPYALVDDLKHPTSSQVVGQAIPFGTLGGAITGRYSRTPTKRIQILKASCAKLENEINAYCVDLTFSPWTGEGGISDMANIYPFGEDGDPIPIYPQIVERHNILRNDSGFKSLLDAWGVHLRELEELLDDYGLSEANARQVVKPTQPSTNRQGNYTGQQLVKAPRRTEEEVEELNRQAVRSGSRIRYGRKFDSYPHTDEEAAAELQKLQSMVEEFTSE